MNRADIDRWIRYHSEISYHLTMERTALESELIPVSVYIIIVCVECYRRYPDMIQAITAATSPEDLGRAGHDLTTEIDPVRFWAVPNFHLIGRNVLFAAGLVDPEADERGLGIVLDFWERASAAYRFDDGTHQAADANGTATPFRALVPDIVAACSPVRDDAERAAISRLNALITSYLFLLWFDTRSGYQDTGPYPLDNGRVLLLRRYNRLGESHFPWSTEFGAALPHHDVLGAFVLNGAQLRVTDFGTSVTDPADYWPHVESYAFFDVSGGALTPLDADARAVLGDAAKKVQKQLYRMIAGMERNEKIDAGAYVYFTFLRPFADAAGVELDWTVPRDSLDLYPFLSLIDGSVEAPPPPTPSEYYLPLPPQ